eukprot:3072537-Prymnesium_polylepis.1
MYRAGGSQPSGTLANVSLSVIELALHRQSQSPWTDILVRMLRYRVIDLSQFVTLVRQLLGQAILTSMIRGIADAQAQQDELMRLPLAAASVASLNGTNELALLPDTVSGGAVVSIAEIRAELRRHATSREDE